MSNSSKKGKPLSRRSFLPILGTSFLFPFLGFGKSSSKKTISKSTGNEYETLLKPDGTIVKIKASSLKNSKVIHKNISNSSFLNWLGKKV
ncbi:hypothetical protein [Yeosuana marina]|uniref:hypothetical protein n=1 Tax=Yeosuana marina TaxID=1565536 RepID=UPI00141E6042|nr:hypothetical protein [Yeosuana marina]